MKTIEITCTNEFKEYNDYFKPFICVSDKKCLNNIIKVGTAIVL